MSAEGRKIEGDSAKHRSRVSNGSTILFTDGRSAGARRFKDLLQGYGEEVGGMAALTTSEGQVVRRLAQASVELEILEATRAAGDAIDPVAFVTLVNTQRRLLKDLDAIKRHRQAEKPTTKLKDMLASRQREAAEVVP